MTPEEKAVLDALVRIDAQTLAVHPLPVSAQLAIQRLKISRTPECAPAPVPCAYPSPTGAMTCELRDGHDRPISFGVGGYARVQHTGRNASGVRRSWIEWVDE